VKPAGTVLALAVTAVSLAAGAWSQPCPVTGISCERVTTVDPETWYPLCVGTKWTYRNTHAMAAVGSQVVRTRWLSSEEVVSRTPCGGSVVVRIEVTPSAIERDYPPGLEAATREWFEKDVGVPQTRGLLVRGSAIYRLAPASWRDPCESLTQERLRQIDASQPEFYFPLEDGAMWSDRQREDLDYSELCAASRGEVPMPNPGFYYWWVEGRKDIDVPWRHGLGAWHLALYTLGGAPHLWFVRNVGVVKERFSHSGSLWETSSELLRFRRGPECGRQK